MNNLSQAYYPIFNSSTSTFVTLPVTTFASIFATATARQHNNGTLDPSPNANTSVITNTMSPLVIELGVLCGVIGTVLAAGLVWCIVSRCRRSRRTSPTLTFDEELEPWNPRDTSHPGSGMPQHAADIPAASLTQAGFEGSPRNWRQNWNSDFRSRNQVASRPQSGAYQEVDELQPQEPTAYQDHDQIYAEYLDPPQQSFEQRLVAGLGMRSRAPSRASRRQRRRRRAERLPPIFETSVDETMRQRDANAPELQPNIYSQRQQYSQHNGGSDVHPVLRRIIAERDLGSVARDGPQ